MNKIQQVMINLFISIMCIIPILNAHNNDSLNKQKKDIEEKFINISTSEVIKTLENKNQKPINEEFEQYLEENPSIVKIIEINNKGTTAFALDVIDFSEDVRKDFENKGNELFSNYKWANRKRDSSAVLGVAGGPGCIIFGVVTQEPIAIGAGVVATLGGLYGWYRYANQAEDISQHIKLTYFMEENWKHKFIDKLIKDNQ